MNYIFDFDGTIADSLPAFIIVFNEMLRKENSPLTKEEIDELRDMSSRRAIRKIGIRWWQIPKLVLRGLPRFQTLLSGLNTFTGLPNVLKEMQARGDKLFIVTSNTRDSVNLFIAKHELQPYFIEISTGAGLFRKSKHIRRLIKKHSLKRKETVYIGDETRDIQAARLSGVRSVSVTWGFNTRRILKRRRPSFLVDDPNELLTIVLK